MGSTSLTTNCPESQRQTHVARCFKCPHWGYAVMSIQRQPSQEHRKRLWIKGGIAFAIVALLVSGWFWVSSTEPLRETISQWSAQQCGTIPFKLDNTTMLDPAATNVDQAETCFIHAFVACHAATLIVTYRGLDTLLTDTFVVEPPMGISRSCRLVVAWHNSVDGDMIQRSGTDTCLQVVQETIALRFQECGWQGSLIIPSIVDVSFL